MHLVFASYKELYFDTITCILQWNLKNLCHRYLYFVVEGKIEPEL